MFGFLLLTPLPAFAATITVTTTANSSGNDGSCSLPEAINSANQDSAFFECSAGTGADTIAFNIAGAGPHTISVPSPLPDISAPVTIDGTSQPGYAGDPVVVLDGSAPTIGGDGLRIESGGEGSTIKGLAIHSFEDHGISITGTATGTTIRANHIGTDAAGMADLGNEDGGIFAATGSTTIGGTGAGDGNLISG
ncbi:MAG: hypothetical protein M3135_01715, partial [Actinomycetota bacterium]|nr:hypothetical protein [Actinomycetota bacterium]